MPEEKDCCHTFLMLLDFHRDPIDSPFKIPDFAGNDYGDA